MYLGKNIRYLRKKAGMSQEELAKIFGYKSFTTIQKWETDDANPPVKVVAKLSEIFNVSIADLTTIDLTGSYSKEYYLDPGTANIAQQIHDKPGLRMCFDALQGTGEKDLETIAAIIYAYKQGHRND